MRRSRSRRPRPPRPRRARSAALALALCAAAAPLAGCGSDDGDDAGSAGAAPTAQQLDGRSFAVTAVSGRELVPGSTVTFAFEGGELGVRGGCNSIGGAYAIADGTLRFAREPISTLIGCEPALQRQDEWLTRLLTAGVAIAAADAETLTLDGDGVTLDLREDDGGGRPPIVGTLWTLETIADAGGTATSVPAGVDPPTLRLTDDGAVAVFAGCNSGGGRARVRDDGFAVFGPLTLTEMACGRAARELERTVVATLAGRVALAYQNDDLVTSRGGRQLVWRAR